MCKWWLIPTASLLPLVSPIARSSQCWCEDQRGLLFCLLIFHSSTTLSLTETYHFLFPSSLCTCLFGLHLQDNFRVSTLAPSLFLLFTLTSRFHLFLFFFLSASFNEVCFAQGNISLSPLCWFIENPLLFIIVLLWKLAIKIHYGTAAIYRDIANNILNLCQTALLQFTLPCWRGEKNCLCS